MEENLISWNVPNILTICLMGLFGYAILKTANKIWLARQGAK